MLRSQCPRSSAVQSEIHQPIRFTTQRQADSPHIQPISLARPPHPTGPAPSTPLGSCESPVCIYDHTVRFSHFIVHLSLYLAIIGILCIGPYILKHLTELHTLSITRLERWSILSPAPYRRQPPLSCMFPEPVLLFHLGPILARRQTPPVHPMGSSYSSLSFHAVSFVLSPSCSRCAYHLPYRYCPRRRPLLRRGLA